jgi:hypothetical protein
MNNPPTTVLVMNSRAYLMLPAFLDTAGRAHSRNEHGPASKD